MTDDLLAIDASSGFCNLRAEQFPLLIQASLDNYQSTITKVKSINSPTWDNAIQPLEEAAENLDRIWSLVSHINSVKNSTDIRNVYEELLPKISDFHTNIMQDEQLYNVYLQVSQLQEFSHLDLAQQTIINNELRDFKLSGVSLSPEQREVFKNLAKKSSLLENDFSNNVLDATEGWTYHITEDQQHLLAGLPEHTLEGAREKAQQQKQTGWILTLDQPCYYSVLTYAQSRDLRKEFYWAYNTRASDQGPNAGKWDNGSLITEILHIRQQMAALVGYRNYAEYSLVPKMAHSTEQVRSFLEDLIFKAKPKAEQEFADLKKFAKQKGHDGQLEAWDVSYYSELCKIENYDVSDEALRAYFPEPRVLTGLFKLVRQLYCIEIEEVADFDKWHESVRMFKVIDQSNNLRGYFYVDLYTREGKRGGAWMAECLSRIRFANDLLQKPIAYLNCNFAPPTEHKPGLLTHDDVITLFHEFGHTLHHVLTQVDYYSVSGTRVAWDAVELPSQFMENWCWEWQVIQDITENVNTGEPLPRSEFDKLLATKNYQSAMALITQIGFALFDFRIHENAGDDFNKSAQEILNSVRKEVAVIPIPEFNRFQNSFCHIFAGGYQAGYYSYLWAEVLSCDAFDMFRSSGLFNIDTGKKFLTHILEQGGSKPAMDLFIAFAGREPEVDALLRHHAIV